MFRRSDRQTNPSNEQQVIVLPPADVQDDNRPYILGVVAGALVGLLGAYFFKRAEQENPGGRPQVKNWQIFNVALTLLTAMRQIAEMGKPPKKER